MIATVFLNKNYILSCILVSRIKGVRWILVLTKSRCWTFKFSTTLIFKVFFINLTVISKNGLQLEFIFRELFFPLYFYRLLCYSGEINRLILNLIKSSRSCIKYSTRLQFMFFPYLYSFPTNPCGVSLLLALIWGRPHAETTLTREACRNIT